MRNKSDFTFFQKTFSLILKFIVIISAVIGTFLSAYAGRYSFMGGRTVYMYFTIQSNIAMAIICTIGAYYLIKNKAISNTLYLIKFIGTVSITLTGIVFCFVLAPTMKHSAWNIQNVLTHVIVPIFCVVDFFVTGINSELENKHVFYVTIPPLVYAIYAGIGYVCNFQFSEGINYPYFFLNWGSPAGAFKFIKDFPFMGTMWWILSLLLFLIVVGFLYQLIIKLIKRKRGLL